MRRSGHRTQVVCTGGHKHAYSEQGRLQACLQADQEIVWSRLTGAGLNNPAATKTGGGPLTPPVLLFREVAATLWGHNHLLMLIQLTERINAPAEDVFALVTDFGYTLPKIDRDMIAVEQLTDGPVGVGTRWRETFRGPGRRPVVMYSEFLIFGSPRRLEAHFSAPGVTGRIAFNCATAGDGTDLEITLRVTPSGPGWLLYPLVRWDTPRREKRRVAMFKRMVESGEMRASELRGRIAQDVARPQRL